MECPFSDKIASEYGVWIRIMTGFHPPWEATNVVVSGQQQYKPRAHHNAFAERATRITGVLVLLPLCPASHSHTPLASLAGGIGWGW